MADATDKMRKAFERWISAPPFEHDCKRRSDDAPITSWPGQYKRFETELAWEAWQAAQQPAQTQVAGWLATHPREPHVRSIFFPGKNRPANHVVTWYDVVWTALYTAPPATTCAACVPMTPPIVFADWLRSNMPPDTIISDPDWWAMAIWSAARRAINAAPVASGGKASVPDDVAKDAARYRWLRKGINALSVQSVAASISWADSHSLPDEPAIWNQVDAAIDAAMLAAAPEPPR